MRSRRQTRGGGSGQGDRCRREMRGREKTSHQWGEERIVCGCEYGLWKLIPTRSARGRRLERGRSRDGHFGGAGWKS